MWWTWWNVRNEVREGKLMKTVEQIASRVRNLASDCLNYCKVTKPIKEQVLERWVPPPNGFLKLNVDGAFLEGQRHGGWGVVVRDDTGSVITAAAGRADGVSNAFMAELMALQNAIELASSLGAIRVVFETDAQLVMYAMNSTKDDFSPAALVISDLKFQCKNWFSRCSIISCRRAVNGVAHELAKIGSKCNPSIMNVWEDDLPANIAVIVMGDLPNSIS
jgi:ribonuclease HI